MNNLKKSIAYLSIMMLTAATIPASTVNAASVPKAGKYYTLKIAGKKQKKKCRNVKVNGKTVKTYAPDSPGPTLLCIQHTGYLKNRKA